MCGSQETDLGEWGHREGSITTQTLETMGLLLRPPFALLTGLWNSMRTRCWGRSMRKRGVLSPNSF